MTKIAPLTTADTILPPDNMRPFYQMANKINELTCTINQQSELISNLNSHMETSTLLFEKMNKRIEYLERANRVREEFEGI